MRLTLTGRHVEITPAISRLVEKKMARLERVLNTRAVSGQVELWLGEVPARRRSARARAGRAHAQGRGPSPRHGTRPCPEAVDRLIQQAQKLKGKWQERKREARPVKRAIPEPRERRRGRAASSGRGATRSGPCRSTRRRSRCRPEPDAFLVFRNTDTDAVSVMFRRKDGDIGLIEPKA